MIAKSQALELRRQKQDSTGIFLIGEILDRKIDSACKYHYLIKWKDYPSSFNSWEPYENLKEAWDMIEEFELKIKKKSEYSKKLLGSKRKKSESKSKSKSESIGKKTDSEPKKQSLSLKQRKLSDESVELIKSSKIADSKPTKIKESLHSYKQLKDEDKKKTEQSKGLVVGISQNEIYPSTPQYVIQIDVLLDGRLTVLVRWESKETSSVIYDNFKRRYPQKLLDFYESRIIFPFENTGTKIFKEKHKPKEDCKEDSI